MFIRLQNPSSNSKNVIFSITHVQAHKYWFNWGGGVNWGEGEGVIWGTNPELKQYLLLEMMRSENLHVNFLEHLQ